jgi:hypothetical protein
VESHILNFNLDAICEPVSKGLQRAYVFSGFGLNAAADPCLTNFHLPSKGQMRFVPDAASPEVTEQYKKDFSMWIVANALREATETLGVSLDRLFEACLITDQVKNRLAELELGALMAFQRKGLPGKLKVLFERFGIKTGLADEFQSLTKARNCLSHRRGIVGAEDCTDAAKTKLVLEFSAFEVFAKQPDGSEVVLSDGALDKGGVVVKEGGEVAMRLAARQVEFPVGAVLRLQPNELSGVFSYVWISVINLRTAFIKLVADLNSALKA